MAEAVQAPGRRHDPVPVLLHPDQLHRAEVGEVDRGPAGQPRGRPPRARLLPRRARHAADAASLRAQRPRRRARRRDTPTGVQPEPGRDQGLPPRRLLATYAPGTNAAGRAGRHRVPARAGRHHRAADALHDQRRAGDRPHEGRADLREGSLTARSCGPAQFINGSFTLPAGAANVAVDADVEFLQDATVWGIFPHTHLRGKKWEYTLVLPDGTRRRSSRCRTTTSTGRPTTCSRSR